MKTKAKAALGLSRLSPEAKVITAQDIVDTMQASAGFPDATMPINYANLQLFIDNLHTAVLQAKNGTPADTSRMHEEERKLMMAFNLIKMHVEMTSNAATDPESMILSSGMSLSANKGQSGLTGLSVEAIGNGVLLIRVPRGENEKAYCYQYATAADPENWQNIGFYSLSKVQFPNQTPGAVLHIRYAAIGKDGMGAFSAAKQIMVL
jgi:hypothetical protein